MRRLSLILTLILFAVLLVPFVGAQGGQSLDQLIADDYRLSTFEAAVNAAGLAETFSGGTWTVFAPTDAAFAKLGLNPENIAKNATTDEVKAFVLYHAIPKFVSMEDAKAMVGDQVMANGSKAGWKWYDGTLYINDTARVIEPNHIASNGNLHIVDTVIQGPWPRPADKSSAVANQGDIKTEDISIAEYLTLDGRFRTANAAVEYAGLDEMLSSGMYTFFAPNNSAFNQFGLNANNMKSLYTPEEMREFLLYHIYPAHMSIAKARTMLGDIRMANGELAGTKWWRRNLWVNDFSQVVFKDIHLANGVIQGVNKVILPPWPRVDPTPVPGLEKAVE